MNRGARLKTKLSLIQEDKKAKKESGNKNHSRTKDWKKERPHTETR
jgi:hypothetical protein